MKKIPTLYKRIYENHKIVGITPEITEGCEEALLHGIATEKTDGSCCAVINGEFYKRYDAKKGKKPPEGAIPCQPEPDPVTGHFPHWVKVDEKNPGDKWFVEAYQRYIFLAGEKPTDGTYEAVGPHFQGNPYMHDHDLLIGHGIFQLEVKRDFESIKNFLDEHYIEGIVFWLDGKPACKIKRSDFGFEWNGGKK